MNNIAIKGETNILNPEINYVQALHLSTPFVVLSPFLGRMVAL